MNHAARRLFKSGFTDVMARLFLVHHRAYVLGQFCVAGACIEAGRQIMIKEREQAGADFTVRGQADA